MTINCRNVPRGVVWLLVAVLTLPAEFTLSAQTPQNQGPPAGPAQGGGGSVLDEIEASEPAAMPSAVKLAQIPESVPLGPGVIDPRASMRVEIANAVDKAGLDGSSGSMSPSADGGVTYTNQSPDGDIIVTGQIVDGQIVLKKEFRPLLNSGELGDPVRIRHKPGAAPGETPPATPVADPAQPTAEQLQAALDATLQQGYQQLLAGAKQVEGPRSIPITETGGFFSSKGETFVPFTDYTIGGLLATRDLYVKQLMTFLSEMSNLRLLSPQARLERIKTMMALAAQAEMWSKLASLSSAMGTFDDAIRIAEQEAAAAEKRGDTALASALREILSKPLTERPALFHQKFLATLDQDPLLAVGDFWETLADGGDPQQYVDGFTATVQQAIHQTHQEINRVRSFTTVVELSEFLKPQYARTRQLGGILLGGPFTKVFQHLEQFATAYTEVKAGQETITGLKVALFTVVVGGIGFVVAAPVALAGAAATAKTIVAGTGLLASGIQLGYDGTRLYGAQVELDNARNASGILGAATLHGLEQQRNAAGGAVVLDTAFVALSAFQLRSALAEVRAAGSGQAAAATTTGGTGASRTPQVMGPWAPLGDTPDVKRGVEAARALGVPESEIDEALRFANQTLDSTGDYKGLSEAARLQVHHERSVNAQLLTQVGQIDDMKAAARAAGVTQAEIDAMHAAAQKTGGLVGFGRQLPTDLLRATLDKRGTIFVIDSVGPSLGRFKSFWRGILPANWFRADLVALSAVISNLNWLRAGRAVRWTADQIALVEKIVARPDASRMFAHVADENVFVRLFSDEVLDAARRFLSAPNRNAIAAGTQTLPAAATAAAPAAGAAPAAAGLLDYAPFGGVLLTGDDAQRAFDQWIDEQEAQEQQTAPAGDTQVGSTLGVSGDFNGDGKPDTFRLTPRVSADPAARVALARGGVIAGEAAPGTVTSLASADVNGDGIDDLIFGGPGPNGAGYVHVAPGGPSLNPGRAFRVNWHSPPALQLPSPPLSVAAGLLNGDTRADIAVGLGDPSKQTGTIRIYPTKPDGTAYSYQTAVIVDISSLPTSMDIGPSNGPQGVRPDADHDLFVGTGSGVLIFENASNGGTLTFDSTPFPLRGPPATGLQVTDVNGDGLVDVLTANPGGTRSTFLGSPSGGYSTPFTGPVGHDPFNFADLRLGDAANVNVVAETPLIDRTRTAAGPPPTVSVVAEPPLIDLPRPAGGTLTFDPTTFANDTGPFNSFGWMQNEPWRDPQITSTLKLMFNPATGLIEFGTQTEGADGVKGDAAQPIPGTQQPKDPHPVARAARGLLDALASIGLRSPVHASRTTSLAWHREDGSPVKPIRVRVADALSYGGAPMAGAPPLKMLISSLGVSTGDAFRLQVINQGAAPVQLDWNGVVLEPLKGASQATVSKMVQEFAGKGAVSGVLTGYCLQFLREPPRPDMLFRIASREMQQKIAPLRKVMQAANRLQKLGVLPADSNPATYFNSIKQWAIWTKEQGFTQDTFKRALVEYTKKNVALAGQPWKKEIEQAVEKLVPQRWQHIQKILTEADK